MYRYRIYLDLGVVVVRFRGRVSVSEIMDYFSEIATDSNYNPNIHGVVDLREATLDMSVEEVESLAKMGAANSKARWVIIVNNPHETAFSVLYSDVVCQSHPLVVVSHEDPASKYLDTDVAVLLEQMAMVS